MDTVLNGIHHTEGSTGAYCFAACEHPTHPQKKIILELDEEKLPKDVFLVVTFSFDIPKSRFVLSCFFVLFCFVDVN